ncbi:MAG: OmpA family protein, partial [Saprospiraceae bacterium]
QNIHAYSLTDNTGTFLVCLPFGENYALNVSKRNYLFHSENFALKEAPEDGKPYELVIELQEIPKEIIAEMPTSKPTYVKPKPIILKNIFFATGSAELKPTSEGELLKLLGLLNENPNMKIQINGHTDDVGSDTDNLSLSENRAKAVKDYLIQKGIISNRLKSKGYGETQPIDTNETQEGKQNNRRTEFEIIN